MKAILVLVSLVAINTAYAGATDSEDEEGGGLYNLNCTYINKYGNETIAAKAVGAGFNEDMVISIAYFDKDGKKQIESVDITYLGPDESGEQNLLQGQTSSGKKVEMILEGEETSTMTVDGVFQKQQKNMTCTMDVVG